MFENAKWISAVNQNNADELAPAPILRREFVVSDNIKSATIHCCGLGLGEYYINGQKITDDVLITPYTRYDKTVLYSSFDVTKLINKGENVVGAVLGNGCYYVHDYRWDKYKAPWNSHPKLIVQLDIEYNDGSKEQVVSDTKWKWSDSPVIYNQTKIGEVYDARLEQDNWSMPEFNDEAWKNVYISRPPGGLLKESTIPPIRITYEYKAINIHDNVYDIGQNISGWVKIKVKGKSGSSVTIKYAECLDHNGKPDYDKLNTIICAQTHTDKYILKGKGEEEWSPRFAYHGFRYFEVIGDAEVVEAVGQFVHTDVAERGEFKCSDPMLNKIHHMTVMASLSNFIGIITDCPQREQNGWTGDALMSIDQMMMNFDVKSLSEKWLMDILDEQRKTGQISCVIPTGGWGYDWGTGPTFDSYMIIAPHKIYEYTGDKSAIEAMWDGMELLMGFMESMSEDYIVNYGLADWRTPPRQEICPAEITDTALYYIDAVTMAKSARLIGKDGTKYEILAQNIKNSFRNKFLKDGRLINKTQTATVCAAYFGLFTEEEKINNIGSLVSEIKNEGYHFKTGIYGTKFMFDVLADCGYNDCLYKMVTNPEMPSYAYWANNGMTTLCETWDLQESLNHHMFSEVDAWFYKHLGGIHFEKGKISVIPEKHNIEEIEIKICGVCLKRCKNHISIETDTPVRFINGGKEIEVMGSYEADLVF